MHRIAILQQSSRITNTRAFFIVVARRFCRTYINKIQGELYEPTRLYLSIYPDVHKYGGSG